MTPMTIIAFGDIHEHLGNIEKIKGISDASSVIITGDLTNRGGIEQAKKIINFLKQYNPNVYAQAGNFDRQEVEDYLIEQKIKDIPFKLFVSHAPPFNTKVDMLQSGLHVGSTAVREFIEKYQPDLCVTGHIHEAKGEDYIGRTLIINPGMLKNRGYVKIFKEKGLLKAVLKQISWF